MLIQDSQLAQEGGAEATPRDGSELESDHPSASNETQQQPSAVVQAKKAADNQKKETFPVIPPTPIKNQRLNIGKSLLTRDVQKGNGHTEGGTKKEKGFGRFKSSLKKR